MTTRDRPIYYVRVEVQGTGQPQPVDLTDRCLTFKFEEDEGKADKLTLTVNNYDLSNFDDPIWRKGNLIETSWGYPGQMTPARTCLIQSVKGARVLTVESLAKSIAMHKVHQMRTFRNVTRAQVVQQVAELNGYSGSRVHVDDTGVVYETVTQNRETDASFLMRLAKREGFQFWVDFDGLHWHKRRLGQQPLREFVWRDGVGDMLDFNVDNDVTAKPASVTLQGRDPLSKSDIGVTGDNSSVARTGLAPDLEVVDPRTGSTTQQANSGQAVIAHTSEASAAGAQRQANGHYANSLLTTVEMTIDAIGDPDVVAKTLITVKNVRSLSGNYYVKGVTTEIGGSDYKMKLKVKRDGRTSLYPPGQRNDAKQNSQQAGDGSGLQPREVVDPRTGQTVTEWVDSRGRAQGTAGD